MSWPIWNIGRQSHHDGPLVIMNTAWWDSWCRWLSDMLIQVVRPSNHTLSEKIANPTVYHHLSRLSIDIQLNGLIKCREDSCVQMKLTQVIFCSLSWFHWPGTSHKLQFSQLPNQHGTTWAVTSTAQWADCFWECRGPLQKSLDLTHTSDRQSWQSIASNLSL